MVWPPGFREARERAVRLAERTTLGVGGRPEFYFEPDRVEEAADVLARCRRAGVPVRILGGGTNLLVMDAPLEGAVVGTRRLGGAACHDDHVVVGTGCSLAGLVRRAIDWQIPVLAGCPGIPGTVGGAVAMNAGGRYGHVGEALLEVVALEKGGRTIRHAVRGADLGYRETRFLREEWLLVSAVFRRDPSLSVDEERRRHARALEEKRSSQPLDGRSAGCIFRNPVKDGQMLSAGRLIEEAGCKGRRIGGAVVSDQHANFILNEGRATAEDVRRLIDLVRLRVYARTGIELELEVRLWL